MPYWTAPNATLYLGDACEQLRQMPTRSVHCVVTSPPYWNLRDYGVDHQLGMEAVPDCLGWATGKPCGSCYVCHMVAVFSEVRRVLRDDGTVWLNLGSTYFSGSGGKNPTQSPVPSRVRTCGIGGKEPGDSQDTDYVCSCLCDECLDSLSNRRVRNGLPPLAASSPSSLTDRGIGRSGSVQASPDASPLSALRSTTPSLPESVQGAFGPSTTASGHPLTQQTSRHFSQVSVRKADCIDGTTEPLDSSASRTEDRELSCAACGNPFKERVGRTYHNYTTGSRLKPGDDAGIPWRVALALQADGWVLRQDIIWYSPNKMPESVQNRCTKSHEHIFLLAKGEGYYFDAAAIQEPFADERNGNPGKYKGMLKSLVTPQGTHGAGVTGSGWNEDKSATGKNKRDVWIVPTTGYPGAHFAVYSPRLITPCILAGTSEYGCCSTCGKPYKRMVVRIGGQVVDGGMEDRDRSFDWSRNGKPGSDSTLDGTVAKRETVGWRKACGCHTAEVVPCIILDPFVGSGTTVATALELGRAGVGIDLSETYLRENAIPRIEATLRGERPKRMASVSAPPDTPPPVADTW